MPSPYTPVEIKATTGRKPKTHYKAYVQKILTEGAPYAARTLREIAKGEIKKPSSQLVATCKYIIDQVIGQPTTRIAPMTGEGITIKHVVVIRPGLMVPDPTMLIEGEAKVLSEGETEGTPDDIMAVQAQDSLT